MTLRLCTPGLYTLRVDFGRPRFRSLGVPVGGAADRWSLALGNALVGNAPDAPALEVTLSGPTVQAACPLACVVCGARFGLSVPGRRLRTGTTFTLQAGEELTIGATPAGMRAYLCVAGGLHGPTVLDSQSSLEALREGDDLTCVPGTIAGRFIRPQPTWNDEPGVLRALDGPQADWFPDHEFFQQPFHIRGESNRMGLRLEGEPIPPPDRELTSEPVCPGAVQVTRDGQCVVLGVDGQTIGGYAKIAQVIQCDLDKLGQLRPGEEVRFRRVTLEEAETLYRRKQVELKEWVVRLRATRNLLGPS